MDTSKSRAKKRNLISQFLWLLRHRPAHVVSQCRGYGLFWLSKWLRELPWVEMRGIELGQNVRLQKNSCLMAESPNAGISIGDHSIIYENAKIEAYDSGKITVGECAVLGDCRICSRYGVKIGKRFLSSWNVFIQDYDSHPTEAERRRQQVQNMVAGFRPRFGSAPASGTQLPGSWDFPGLAVVIGDDVWVGANSTILKGAEIGNGCIVAAGSVVLKGEYPAGSVIAGNPAVIVSGAGQGKFASKDGSHARSCI